MGQMENRKARKKNMAKIGVKGTIVADDDKWIYEYFGIAATCPKDIQAAIMEANGEDLDVEINSGGGDVVAGNEIYTALRMYRGKVNIIISGMAASAASYIATARHCEISPVGIFMIHNASGGARGDYHAMDKESEILQAVNRAIATAYMDKTKMKLDDLLNLMDCESWLTAEEALNYGFVDSIIESQEDAKGAAAKGGFSDGKKKTALYNAATVLDRETIDRTKEMLARASEKPGNTAPEGVPKPPESVLNNQNQKKVEVKEMADTTQESISTVEELTAKYPALVQQIKDSASLEATAAENARLKAIDEIAGQISDKMVADAKYGEKKVTAEALALEAFRQNGIMAAAALSDMKEDIGESGAGEVAPSANTGLADDSGEQREAKVNNLAQKIKESRGKRA